MVRIDLVIRVGQVTRIDLVFRVGQAIRIDLVIRMEICIPDLTD